jgi:hypothetical protein
MKRSLPWAADEVANARQKFTYEQDTRTPLSTSLMQDSADSSIKALPSLISAMSAAKPPEGFGTNIYPHYGTEAAINALSNLPGNIINDRAAALQLKSAEAQLPVTQQKATTELQEQQIAQNRLKGLLNPGTDSNGNPKPDISGNVTSINGSNVAVAPLPIPFGAGVAPVTVTPVPQTQQQTQPTPQPVSTQQQTSQTTTLPAAPMAPSVTKPILSHALFGTPLPPLSSSAPANPTPDLVGHPATPANVLSWYQQTHDTRAVDAKSETDANGLPTGNTVIIHSPKSGLTDQVVHPGHYLLATQPPPENANPALASDPSESLQAGTLSPQQS